MSVRHYRLLLIEDDDLDVEKIKRSLKRLEINAELRVARDGREGLAALRECIEEDALGQPPLVLLDLNIPRLNGIEFLAEVRADPQLAMAPVFVMSTSTRAEDVNAAFQYNVAGYFSKPITMTDTYATVRALHQFWLLTLLPEPVVGLRRGHQRELRTDQRSAN